MGKTREEQPLGFLQLDKASTWQSETPMAGTGRGSGTRAIREGNEAELRQSSFEPGGRYRRI